MTLSSLNLQSRLLTDKPRKIEQMTVSVVMCAYTMDRWADLQQAIQSVEDQASRPDEIILVIDHNPTLVRMAQERFAGVKVIENRESKGLSGARNSGIAAASGEIITFMDEDAIAEPTWIERLLEVYGDNEVIGAGGQVKPLWPGEAPKWFPEEFGWVVGCSYKGLPTGISRIRNPIGCNMSFRREALIAAGGFRNGIGRVGTLPVGCEETEVSIRIQQATPGSKIMYNPEAVVFHRVPEWRTTWRYFISRCYSEGISKATIASLVGASDSVASEKQYITKTLSASVLRNVQAAVSHGEMRALMQAGAILAGLLTTITGYLAGSARRTFAQAKPSYTSSSILQRDSETEPAGAEIKHTSI